MKIGKYHLDNCSACIMGILNVTPDSFSDGGRYVNIDKALEQVELMLKQGAKIIDVGGESTRPGATFVSAEEEIARTIPIIKAIKEHFNCLISIDTYKAQTARAAIQAGADIINDVWGGLYDPEILQVSVDYNVPIILMHNQKEANYHDIVLEVEQHLMMCVNKALVAGVLKDNIWIDPGFGFAKDAQQNIKLLKGLDQICQLGYPVLFGISRKRTVGALLGDEPVPEQRDQGTAALSAWAISKGCQIVRVHNVEKNADIVTVISQLVEE